VALILVCQIHFAFQFQGADAIDLGVAYQVINSLYSCKWNTAFQFRVRAIEARTSGRKITPRSPRENKTQI
tara:strand:+ start:1919 stop:2131 length:213 start_codon:yes stop_codon:yes gene_type:complete